MVSRLLSRGVGNIPKNRVIPGIFVQDRISCRPVVEVLIAGIGFCITYFSIAVNHAIKYHDQGNSQKSLFRLMVPEEYKSTMVEWRHGG